jgi:hypothetical protein
MGSNGTDTALRGDEALLVELAAGRRVEDAARAAGMSRSAAYRRLEDRGFAQRVRNERRRLVGLAVGRLAANAALFADTLVEIAANPNAPAGTRIAAARAGLEIGTRLRETVHAEDATAWMNDLING